MKTRLLSLTILLICILFQETSAQTTAAIDPWVISAYSPDPSNYYGVTVANGMIGIVSSPLPFQVKDVVLAGAYDLYGRGRVSNFLKSFNLLNMHFSVDGSRSFFRKYFVYETDAEYAACEFHHFFQLPG